MSDRAGLLGTLTTLTPLRDAAGARAELASWEQSPFAGVPGTHFARYVVVDEVRREAAAQPDQPLPAPLLLFSAVFDGDAELWLEGIAPVEHVWRHCAGWPGTGHALRRWLLTHRVPATAFYAASAEASLADVRAALAFRERFRDLAFDGPPDLGAFLAFAERES